MRLNAKQDRQGVRTAAELERKYQFEKQFNTFSNYAQDNRQNIKKQGDSLQGEIVALEQRTVELINETARRYTPLTSFDALSEQVGSVEQSLTNYTPKSSFNQLDSEVETLSDSLDEHKTEFNNHKTEYNALKSKVDSLIEEGTSDGWFYRKWSSGTAECWKICEFKTTINTAFGSLYCGNAAQRQTYPFVFTEKPVENVTLQSASTQAILYCEASGYGVNGTNQTARYNVFRPGAMASEQTFYLSFYVIGKWK
jgi:hypothetical protein